MIGRTKRKDYEQFEESVIEAGKIMRGEASPPREFVYEVDASETQEKVETWAVSASKPITKPSRFRKKLKKDW